MNAADPNKRAESPDSKKRSKSRSRSPRRRQLESKLENLKEARQKALDAIKVEMDKADAFKRALHERSKKVHNEYLMPMHLLEQALDPYKLMDKATVMAKTRNTAFLFDVGDKSPFAWYGPDAKVQDIVVCDWHDKSSIVHDVAKIINSKFKVCTKSFVYQTFRVTARVDTDDETALDLSRWPDVEYGYEGISDVHASHGRKLEYDRTTWHTSKPRERDVEFDASEFDGLTVSEPSFETTHVLDDVLVLIPRA